MKKSKKNNSGGFTLVELIVVLIILTILAAILVPALLGWIDKAKEKQYLLEARNVVMAAQAAATENYATGTFDGDAASFLNKYQDEILKTADVKIIAGKSRIPELVFRDKDGKKIAIIKRLVYTADDDTLIIYDIDESPVYQIGEEVGAKSYQKPWADVIDKAGATSTSAMREEIKKLYGNEYPSLLASEKALFSSALGLKTPDKIDNLSWKPIEVKSAKDGFLIIASDIPASNTGQNLKSTMVYYEGNYYACVNGNNKKYNDVFITNDFDVSTLKNAQVFSYYETHPDELGSSTWVRL